MTVERKRFADTFSGNGNVVTVLSLARQPCQNQTVHNNCTSKPKPV